MTALAALEKGTGTRDLTAVPENRIVVALSVLIGSLTAGWSRESLVAAQASPRERLKLLHEKLNGMAEAIYDRR